MGGFLLRWVVNTVALWIVAMLFGYEYGSLPWLFVASAVLGLCNAIVKPVLFWLTLPITIVTLGLFLIVINGLMLMLTDLLVGPFDVISFWRAAGGAIVLGIISLFTNRIGKKKED